MKIAETYSVWNGLEYMQIQQIELWKEIEKIIQSIDAEKYKIKAKNNHSCYNFKMIKNNFQTELLACKWEKTAKNTPIRSYNQTDFVKNRVALEVQFGKYSFVAYDLFVKHLAFYIGDHIDVGIEILPMKKLQAQMSSGPSYYEGELYNVVRQGRGVPAVPLVIIGIEP
jgi:hypothetical protein